tara:strand:+ start:81 stop:314 length:234 start_codon:yes stop_codon:yes gene_type:complete
MKRTRSYTLSDDVITILKYKPNKTEFVERAVRKLHKQEEDFDISDVPTRQLMAVLQQREDCVRHIKIILWDQLQAQS